MHCTLQLLPDCLQSQGEREGVGGYRLGVLHTDTRARAGACVHTSARACLVICMLHASACAPVFYLVHHSLPLHGTLALKKCADDVNRDMAAVAVHILNVDLGAPTNTHTGMEGQSWGWVQGWDVALHTGT